ncbi:hypothetical protein E3AUHO_50950 [Klebsiella pneumoniae subsp. pneumoniae]|nr:hypothetical protein E3AUHO_50950 [Klebsiella pneumoniae subsp. pneumoniae]
MFYETSSGCEVKLRAAQGFIDSIFTLMNVPLRCPDYTSVSKRAKSVNVSFKTFTRGEIAHLVIDSTGLKVFLSIQMFPVTTP